ncbi:MAG TPA: transcription termination factor NusA, partial [Candidatus Cloacimonadota bacterium]|nr:transcription termination factor NusA [Candidatus Cloacimonadota bacterium]
MSASLLASLNELANLKQLDKKKIQEIIQNSLYQSIEKKLEPESELEIIADFDSNTVVAKFNRVVVDTDTKLGEISLQDARSEYGNHIEIGDNIRAEMAINEFEPKVIKNARKAIQENFKKLEEDRIMFDYEKQKNTIVSGRVKSNEFNGYKVDIGYTEALLPPEEQVEDEYYKNGDIIRAYVVNIRKKDSGVTVILSRTNPEFVKKLFELEVPEVLTKDIEIKKIVREPGIRTKVEVVSNNKSIDVSGSCLGVKGLRLEHIRKELHGEQIDIVPFDENPEQLIASSVGDDVVERVIVSERGKFARVIVSEKNKNLAIGKKGQNVKLAAKLTG